VVSELERGPIDSSTAAKFPGHPPLPVHRGERRKDCDSFNSAICHLLFRWHSGRICLNCAMWGIDVLAAIVIVGGLREVLCYTR
jgi:hypothetical protein